MKILIIEDDTDLGGLLREYLQRLSHAKVQVCVTGKEAYLAILQESFDCAFIDLRLPDIDGLKLLEAFKKRASSIPVVMMSGFATMEYAIEAMRKGASDFLTKPFTLQSVTLTLEKVTKERKLLLENLSLQLERNVRKELETVNRALERKVEEQVKLFEISREIDEIRSSEELYPCVVKLASNIGKTLNAGLFVLPPGQTTVMLMAEHGAWLSDTAPAIFRLSVDRIKKILGERKSHFLMRPEKLIEDFGFSEQFISREQWLSCWPLRIRGELFGFLIACHNGKKRHLTATAIKLLDFLVKKSALAIENMALYESLIGNFHGILKSLINALEAKDLYTGKHSERVTKYATSIGRKMGISGSQIEALNTIAYLHDIGKIGIRDSILNKRGPLTVDEYELVKQHPTIGESIVAELGLNVDERSIIRNHHEHWDGSGYPDGLAREDIPPLARVVAVADAFDAMTSKRAYREAMSRKDALLRMKKDRGHHFDPKVLDAFLEVLGDE